MPRPAAVPLRSNLVTGRSAQRSTTRKTAPQVAVIGTTGGMSGHGKSRRRHVRTWRAPPAQDSTPQRAEQPSLPFSPRELGGRRRARQFTRPLA